MPTPSEARLKADEIRNQRGQIILHITLVRTICWNCSGIASQLPTPHGRHSLNYAPHKRTRFFCIILHFGSSFVLFIIQARKLTSASSATMWSCLLVQYLILQIMLAEISSGHYTRLPMRRVTGRFIIPFVSNKYLTKKVCCFLLGSLLEFFTPNEPRANYLVEGSEECAAK